VHGLSRLRGPLLALLSITLVIAVVEGWARNRPLPRIQQVYDDGRSYLFDHDGDPYWVPKDPDMDHRNLDCVTADSRNAVLIGDSILYGSRVLRQRALAAQLQARWREQPGAGQACIVNLSQPGYASQQQLATARANLAAQRPEVVFWEIWGNGPNRFERVGDAVYNFGTLAPDGGVPSPFGVEAALNRTLFAHSGLYRRLVLGAALPVAPAAGVSQSSRWADLVATDLTEARALVEGLGAELVLVYCPPLDRPLAETADRPLADFQPIRDWSTREGVRSIVLAEELRDHDVEAIRLDTCCHFNEHGLGLVADALLPVLID